MTDSRKVRRPPQPQLRYRYEPTRFEKAMFWSLVPATVLLPVWHVAGRTIIGGPGGWGSIFLIFTWAPVTFLYHVLLLALSVFKNRRRLLHSKKESSPINSSSMRNYFISEQSAFILALYYGVCILVQLFMKDGDDQGSVGSIMTHWLGISGRLSSEIGWLLFSASVALAVELIFLAIVDPLPGEPRLDLIERTKANVASRVFLARQYLVSC